MNNVLAFSAVAIIKDIFAQRGIGPDQLPPASPELLPIDETAEADRAARVQQDVGPVAPGLVQYTSDLSSMSLRCPSLWILWQRRRRQHSRAVGEHLELGAVQDLSHP